MSDFPLYNAAKSRDWSLCVFFSVDIEGATAYKIGTRLQEGDDKWCLLFASFYTDFPTYFFNEYNALPVATHRDESVVDPPVIPTLWKFVGDEILFYAQLTDAMQTLEHLYAFRQALIKYNERLKKDGVKVRCKGTAWIAGFPINNRIMLIPNAQKTLNSDETLTNPSIDFIGSSIDCGFRLTKFATARNLVVSLDLLWMITQSLAYLPESAKSGYTFLDSKIMYGGKHELKGIFSGKPYPIFWIDTFIKPLVEDKWERCTVCCNCEDILNFCKEFETNVSSNDFIKPFIKDDPSGLFGTIPEEFIGRQNLLAIYADDTVDSYGIIGEHQLDEKENAQVEIKPIQVDDQELGSDENY
jgi:hypothetical protein